MGKISAVIAALSVTVLIFGQIYSFDGRYFHSIKNARQLISDDNNNSVDINPYTFSSSSSEKPSTETDSSKTAIVALIPNTDTDLFDFCLALKSLENLPDREHSDDVAVFAFHEGDLGKYQIYAILQCAGDKRLVSFPKIDFRGDYPEGFDPITEARKAAHVSNAGRQLGRKAWGYTQMVRFWTTRVWQQPALEGYDTIMRIDTDSCFQLVASEELDKDIHLPFLRSDFVYQSMQSPRMLGSPHYSDGLYDFTVEYMKKENITPKFPALWEKIDYLWRIRQELPVMQTNLEIGRRDFFTRPDVLKWHRALTEEEPFGVFRERWGDAQTRVITMALFATEGSVLMSPTPGYFHGRGVCKTYYEVKGARSLADYMGY